MYRPLRTFLAAAPWQRSFLTASGVFALAVVAVFTVRAARQRVVVAPGGLGPVETEFSALPVRVEVVALADQLAAEAQRLSGDRRIERLLRAAQLRERIWRLERRAADALEAIELYRSAAAAGSCRAELAAAALQAEYDGRPLPTAKAAPSADCSTQVREVATVLRAFSGGPGTQPGTLASAAVSADDAGGVATPASLGSASAEGATITRVERYGAKDAARIVVSMSRPAAFQVGFLKEGDDGGTPRLYVDVEGAKSSASPSYEVGGLVERVRLGQHASATRIVLDLSAHVERRVFYLPEPFRLVIDVSRRDSAAPGSSAPRALSRVVLDPGHGGHDPGAIGPRGLREKDVTLDIAHRAAPVIARELGLVTLLTRDVDAYVGLDERTARANAFAADLFVSIHCNAAGNTGSDGVMSFVLDESSDAAASRMAALENAASAAAASELARSLVRVQDSLTLRRSVHFAELLQRSTVASLLPGYGKIPDQGVKRAGFYVLAGAHMPAVLYEVSFISNPDGEVRLNTGDYRQKLADAVVNAIRAYRDGL